MVAAAIGGSALAGLAGSAMTASAASSAADKQAAAADRASANAMAQYQQTRSDLSPYRDAGAGALNSFQTALGIGGTPGTPNPLTSNGLSGLTFQPTEAQLAATPGYQFVLGQGLQSVQNSNAAAGRGISGAALKGAANYATGLANNTLTTQQGIFQQNLGNVINPLQSLIGTGENASAQTGQQGLQAVSNSNAALIGGANAQAAGTIGSANALAGGLNSVGGAGTNYLLYNNLLSGGTTGTYYPNYSGPSGVSPAVDRALGYS